MDQSVGSPRGAGAGGKGGGTSGSAPLKGVNLLEENLGRP